MPFILLTYMEYSFDKLFMRRQQSKVIHQTIFFEDGPWVEKV